MQDPNSGHMSNTVQKFPQNKSKDEYRQAYIHPVTDHRGGCLPLGGPLYAAPSLFLNRAALPR